MHSTETSSVVRRANSLNVYSASTINQVRCALPESVVMTDNDSTLDNFEQHLVCDKQESALKRWLKDRKKKSKSSCKKREQNAALKSARYHYYDQCSPTTTTETLRKVHTWS